MVEVDVKGCQPTIWAALSGDEAIRQDIAENSFYEQIAECVLNATRDDAKEHFGVCLFGEKRDTVRKQRKVLEHFINRYPAGFVYSRSMDGRALARKFQACEASIMIDGVLAELIADKIFALTVHDAVFCLQKDTEKVKAAIENHSRRVLGVPFLFKG